ncbi:MAG: hypothetical protein QGH83_01255, partial [Candidatus Pacebacteria bacterium]|nr:hypothetical protein [Candidatus Paceibacterota bacterium]
MPNTELSEFFNIVSKEKNENLEKIKKDIENPKSDLANLFKQLETAHKEVTQPSEEISDEKILSTEDQNRLEVFSNLLNSFDSAKEIPEEVIIELPSEPIEPVEEPEEIDVELINFVEGIEEAVEEIEEVEEEIPESETVKTDNIIQEIVNSLDEMGEKTEVKEEIDQIAALRRDFNNFKNLIQRDIANQKMSGAGSGEVRLEFLDDVDRDSVKSDGKALVYDSSDGKWKGESVLTGAITGLDIDGATDIGDAIADADLFIIDDGAGGTNRKTAASRLKTYIGAGAADDLSAGDAAVTLTTTSGNITIDAAANNTDIIFKGTDGDSDITMLTLDGSEAGAATFNDKIVATELDISGNVDIDGTLETDALTIDGTTLAETIADTVGAMVGSNTETGITVTYEDGDNTLDFAVGTLNQDTTGLAGTATALANARTIGGTSFDGTANIAVALSATSTALASARTIH